MTTTTKNITVTINGTEICADMATIASLLNIAANAEAPKAEAPKAKAPKAKASKAKAEAPKAKAEAVRAKHDAILDSKRVERMAKTAVDRAKAQGFDCKTRKQGKWIWLYPTNGQGRSPEFKALKLAKGWNYSIKRGAFFRDFS